MAASPRLFITDGCPFVLKVLTFLTDAKLLDKGVVTITPDAPEHRAYVTQKAGRPADFPALDLPDRIIMCPNEDELIQYLADQNGVDIATLPVFNAYVNGVFPRYRKMLGYVVKAEGGWPKLFPAIGVKSVFVLGGSGMVGSRIAAEARRRGHVVTRAGRSAAPKPGVFAENGNRKVAVDAYDADGLAAALKAANADVVVCAMGPSRTDASAPPLVDAWNAVLAACRAVEGKDVRALFVGGAGSLLQAPGGDLQIDNPHFPEGYKNEARQHIDALAMVRAVGDVAWTVPTPAPMIAPGARTGKYRSGGDVVLGMSISAEDFAVAAVDEIDNAAHDKERFAVAAADTE